MQRNYKSAAIGLFALLGLLGVLKSQASANVQEVFGMSPRAIGMGNAYSAVADDFSAVYYNPAGLAQIRHHQLFLGYLYGQPRLKQYLPGENGRMSLLGDKKFDAPLIGITVDLSKFIDLNRRINFGMFASIGENLKGAWRIHDWAPENPRFIRYGDTANRIHMFMGTGIEVIKNKLFVGASLNMWQDIGIPELNVRTDLRGNIYAKDVDIDGNWELAPIGGLLFVPMDWLKLSYTYRGEMQQKNPQKINATADLIPGASPGIELPISQRLMFIDYYLPQNHTWGLALRPIDRLLVSFDLTWYKWSDFSIPSWHATPVRKWKDTYVPRVGAEYELYKNFFVRMGYWHEESPVPDQQDIPSNYLDNDKNVLSWGVGYALENLHIPFTQAKLKYPLLLDAFVQYQMMENRNQEKDPSVGQPSWRADGYQIAGGVGLTLQF
jgi:long-chain fatty acid transport protein